MFQNDELQIYGGEDYIINDHIVIHQCSLKEIREFGEQKYLQLVQTFTATPTDMKYMLYQAGIDWNECEDFRLFLMNYEFFTKERTEILFGDLDISAYKLSRSKQNDEICLYNEETDSVIDKSIYEMIVSYLRDSHCLKKNVERAMTETAHEVLIEEAKENYEMNKDKPFKSILKPLISTLRNMPGCSETRETIWDMKINEFMDSVQRTQKINTVNLLLQSGYSGFGIDLKKITNKNVLNHFGELDS